MQRVIVVLLAVLIVVVGVFGALTWSAQRSTNDRLDTIECIARIDATAAAALMVPDEAVDQQGRLDSARTLSSLLDDC